MGASPHVGPPPVDKEPTPAPARFGRFELIERVGAGGMAEVFRAAVVGPEGFRREIVVKRVLPQLSTRARFTQMFVNEAKISALLTHPNIVQIFEFGESEGAYFIAMESVRGLTLREVLTRLREQERVMPIVAAAEIIRDVLSALDYAHSLQDQEGRPLGIVHRDVSPSNVMLADTGAVKVLDFGIARAADLMSPDEGHVVKGKISYLAPEQIACGDIDGRADVFAVGCLLHELLTGRIMFRAQNNLQKKIDLLAQASLPPSAWNSEVPRALDAVVARATARDRDARYASAADMLADLENYLSAFRSSSRSILRLMRSLSTGPRDEDTAQPSTLTSGAATAALPAGSSSSAATRPAKFPPLSPGARAAGTPPANSDGLEEGDSSSSGRGEVVPPPGGARLRLLDGAASAERIRAARAIWRRRILVAAALLVGIGTVGAAVVGAQSLWARMARPSAATTKSRAAAAEFVLVTFVTTPAGARIIDAGGRAVGTTPATLPVTPSKIPVPFRFELEGYRPATSSIIADGDKTLDIELKVVRKMEKPARKPPASKHPAPKR